MTDQFTANDPLGLLRSMWGNMSSMGNGMGLSMPGMMTPTFDVEELEKRINDLKAVEGWLRMNLSMLQMTIQGLEMQKATLTVVQAMGDAASKAREATESVEQAAEAAVEEAAGTAPSWPWSIMQQMQEAIQQATPAVEAAAQSAKKTAPRRPRKPKATK